MSFCFKEEYNVKIFFLTQLLNGSGFRGSTSTQTIIGNDLITGLILLGIIGKIRIGMMKSVVFVGNYRWFEECIESQKHKHLVCMWLSVLLGIRIWVNERK